MPSSAMPATSLASPTVNQNSAGNELISEPKPSGPNSAPAPR